MKNEKRKSSKGKMIFIFVVNKVGYKIRKISMFEENTSGKRTLLIVVHQFLQLVHRILGRLKGYLLYTYICVHTVYVCTRAYSRFHAAQRNYAYEPAFLRLIPSITYEPHCLIVVNG